MKLLLILMLVTLTVSDKLDNTYLPPHDARTAGGEGLATPFGPRRGGEEVHFGGARPEGALGTFGNTNAFGRRPSTSADGVRGGPTVEHFRDTFSDRAYHTEAGRVGSTGVESNGFRGEAGDRRNSGVAGGAQEQYPAARAGSFGQQIAIVRFNNENFGDGTYRFEFESENGIQQSEQGQPKEPESYEVQGAVAYTSPEGQLITLNYIADENGFQPSGDHLPTAPPIPEEILRSLEKNAADEAAGIIDDGQYRGDQRNQVQGYGQQQEYGSGSQRQGNAGQYQEGQRGQSTGGFGAVQHGAGDYGGQRGPSAGAHGTGTTAFGSGTPGSRGSGRAPNRQYESPQSNVVENGGYRY